MKRLFLTLLFCAGSAAAFSNPFSSSALPLAKRMIQVRFTVDNDQLLQQPYLEVSVVEDRFRKSAVAIKNEGGRLGKGMSDISVPDGPVQLSICGLVKCSGREEGEMVCGRTVIPSSIEIFKEHQVMFSTNWACRDGAALVVSR